MYRVKLCRVATQVLCLSFAQAFVVSTIYLPIMAPPAWGQASTIDTVPDNQRRSRQELEEAEKAAERARIQRLIEGDGDVTYADVLKDPDNIELNFRFAQT